ncbi:NAD-glutamate dehydrogenase [Motiliproteus sp. SC1-56]|uniref:NAD-glutamate dehydrogenase n=1 Tax=Motiliproteus sp. SC1-56 TaxID=2799565 RepID=UPI001A8CBDEE|nr:NAD-glutamate dehydrogenase [Motiliproteus sp. SC1-56]
MKTSKVGGHQPILDSLEELLRRNLPGEEADTALQLASLLYVSASAEEVSQRRLDDLYGATLECWRFLQHYPGGGGKVRVFNPDLEQNGWQSTHSAILLLHPDMPFMIDSVRIEINRRDLTIHSIQNSIMAVQRDKQGQLQQLLPSQGAAAELPRESLIYLEVDRHTDPAQMHSLQESLQSVLAEVRLVTDDFLAMKAEAKALLDELDHYPGRLSKRNLKEVKDFVRWMLDDHFTFLGCDERRVVNREGRSLLESIEGTRLGLLKTQEEADAHTPVEMHPEGPMQIHQVLSFAKSPRKARVHRPAYSDFIALKKFDENGELVGERRFLGLYTSPAYFQSATKIPVIRRKVEKVLERAGLHPGSHDWKDMQQILEVYPRDDLFQIDVDNLYETALGILHIHERRQVRLFLRQDAHGRYYSCLVYVPRDLYSTDFRIKVQRILGEELGSELIEFTTQFSESILARTHFTVHLPEGAEPQDQDVNHIERRVQDAARSWGDELYQALVEFHGEENGIRLANAYQEGFPSSYRDDFSPRTAVADIGHMEPLNAENPLGMSFYRSMERVDDQVNFKLFHFQGPVPLSEVIPVMEHLGLKVMDEHPYAIHGERGTYWIHDFSMLHREGGSIDLERVKTIFQDAFAHVWRGEAESDEFNRLVLTVPLGWREVAMLRAYAGYMKQIGFPFSQTAIAASLRQHRGITRKLVELFRRRFDPDQKSRKTKALVDDIKGRLEEVPSLTDDRILRKYLEILRATLRTNFFRTEADGAPRPFFSFKFSPRKIRDIPEPRPMFEIFVYSPRVEGVHLRGGRVARGGLRWSDRYEDFRTEVLGLVKAQQVKNAVIVPVGAKGGFVAKRLVDGMGHEERLQEGIACYRDFIRGLLDLTDNRVQEGVVSPPQVVCHDDEDPYLVVAADKGTASFSDIANAIAGEYGFWLGDAFASGGSQGYDHKKMGITARGAWVSVERHFREQGLDTSKTDFTVVGIGDMGGDVFGNGMLLSRHICLVAAFNHRHIFIDPNPDAQASFTERQRLFTQPNGGWDAYDASLISEGGGVFPRSLKSVPISPQMKQRFAIDESRLTPSELIHRLLQAPVDLLWNGGIGTYVKSSTQSHGEVGDKANDGLRIDANQLRCRVVGEGGNLGMTQLARVEYSLKGGACNTDFIDNAGGVDCSDHEVNIKILLDRVVAAGDLTLKQRNQLLSDMTEEVAGLVLKNSYRQAQALSLAQSKVMEKFGEYRRFIETLEGSERLDRALEFIPGDEQLAERRAAGAGLTRPELSVLLSYAKAAIKEELVVSELPDDPYLAREALTAFPGLLLERYGDAVEEHPLRRELVATQVANHLVNQMGVTYVHRLRVSTGADTAAVARAYLLAREVFGLDRLWSEIEALDNRVDAQVQLRMMNETQRLVRRSGRWFLRNRRRFLDPEGEVKRFGEQVALLRDNMGHWLQGTPAQGWKDRYYYYQQSGVPDTLAARVASAEGLYAALAIIEVAAETGTELAQVVAVYCTLGERLDLYWFAHKVTDLVVENQWQALAREAFRDDLDWQVRAIAEAVLRLCDPGQPADECFDRWMQEHEQMVTRWLQMLGELKTADHHDYSMYTVATRELFDLAKESAIAP